MNELVELTFGENRNSKVSVAKTYFFWIDEGVEKPLFKLPANIATRKIKFSSQSIQSIDGRSTVFSMIFCQESVLKMFTSYTRHGRPKCVAAIYLSVNEEAPLIILNGFTGFGSFRGRAWVLNTDINETELKSQFDFQVIAKGKSITKDVPRRIIW